MHVRDPGRARVATWLRVAPAAMLIVFFAVVLRPGTAAVPGADRAAASREPVDSPTFSEHVAPILVRHCSACHRPDGPAPFSVLRYETAAAMAPLIARATRERRMPPWMPAPGRGEFLDERRLTEEEIGTLEAWADAGAPAGDSGGLVVADVVEDGWYLGEPDLVIEMPRPFQLPAGAPEMFRHFVVPVPLTETRWVEAVELRISEPRVVHHLNLMVDRTATSRRREAHDPEPGFDAMHGAGTQIMPPGFFLGWTPGRVPRRDDRGLAWRLDAGTDLVLEFHLQPTARPATLTAKLGFHFAEKAPEREPTVIKLTSETIDISAGARDHLVTDEYVLPVDVEVLGVYPHAHYLAREFRVFAVLPGETERRWLLHIPRWDFNWQDAYEYREPVRLPAGTTLRMELIYDNSEDNPVNPHSPPRRVRHGPLSTDEMADVYLRVVARDAGELAELERDLTVWTLRKQLAHLSRRLEDDPADLDALLGIGGLYASVNAFDRAERFYRRALEIDPDDVTTRYNLGAVLQAQGKAREALSHFEAALRLGADNARVHFAMAAVLDELGRTEEALPHAVLAAEAFDAAGDAETARRIAAQVLAAAESSGEADLVRRLGALLAED